MNRPERVNLRKVLLAVGVVAAATLLGLVIQQLTGGRVPFVVIFPTLIVLGVIIGVVWFRLRGADERVQQTQQLLHAMLESTPAIVFVKDRAGIVRVANRGYARLAGRAAEQLIGRPDEIFTEMDVDTGTDPQSAKPTARRLTLRDGERTFFTLTRPIIHDDQTMVYGFALDISDRQHTEQALSESEERLRLAAQIAGFGTYDADLTTGVCHWSDELKAIFGVPADEAVEVEPELVPAFIHPDDRERVQREMEESCHSTHPGHFESNYRIVRRDGEVRSVLARGRTMFQSGPGGRKAVRATGMVLDVTERVRAAEALREANRTLEQRVAERTAEVRRQANDLRRMAGEVARADQEARRRIARVLHDGLQQVLVAARMQIELLRAEAGDAHGEELATARKLLDESIQITRDLSVELNPPVLHERGLAAALQWLGKRFAERHRFQVQVDAAEPDDPASPDTRTVLFDAAQELLLNAVKHAGTDSAEVRVQREQDRVRLIVEDHGRGADPTSIDVSAAHPGHSTGLHNLRQRLALIGGKLDIQTAPGKGCRIQLEAPSQATTGDETTS